MEPERGDSAVLAAEDLTRPGRKGSTYALFRRDGPALEPEKMRERMELSQWARD